jgi:hypothetical protein
MLSEIADTFSLKRADSGIDTKDAKPSCDANAL